MNIYGDMRICCVSNCDNKADVVATYKLYHELLDVIREDPTIEDKDLYFRQALLRGRQVAAIGKMINTGLPVDRNNLVNVKNNLENITEHFIKKANKVIFTKILFILS